MKPTIIISSCILLLIANATAAFIATTLQLPAWIFGGFLALSTAYFLRLCWRLHQQGRAERYLGYIDRVARHCPACNLSHFITETKAGACPDCGGELTGLPYIITEHGPASIKQSPEA